MATMTQIRQKIRNMTGSQDATQLTDAQINDYINDYYVNRFLMEFSTLRLESWFTFTTLPNEDTYPVSDEYLVLKQPIWFGGQEGRLHMNPRMFYNLYLPTKTQGQVGTGNGGVSYSFTLNSTPVLEGSVLVNAGSETFTDDSGTLESNLGGTGTINYITGAVSLTFNQPVASGAIINAEWQPYVASRPRDALFYEQQLTLRPVPDMAYEVRMAALLRPDVLLTGDSTPYSEWGNVLALGASLLIFEDRGDFDNIQKYTMLYDDRVASAQRRTLRQLATQRAPSPYMTEEMNPYPQTNYPSF